MEPEKCEGWEWMEFGTDEMDMMASTGKMFLPLAKLYEGYKLGSWAPEELKTPVVDDDDD